MYVIYLYDEDMAYLDVYAKRPRYGSKLLSMEVPNLGLINL